MHQDELRRIDRVEVCCRVDVRDRFGVWTAVTEDVCGRGCRLVTPKLPRLGSLLELTFSSDLFSESLEVVGRTVWASLDRVGVTFLEPSDRGLTPAQWLQRVIEHGRVVAPGPRALGAPRVVPVVQRASRQEARGSVPRREGDVVVPFRVTQG